MSTRRYEPNHPFTWRGDPREEPGESLSRRIGRREIADLERSLGAYGAAGQLSSVPRAGWQGFDADGSTTTTRQSLFPNSIRCCRVGT